MLSMAELKRLANSRPVIDKTAVVAFQSRPHPVALRPDNDTGSGCNENVVAAFLASTPVPLMYSNMRAHCVLEDGVAFLHWRFIPAP